MAISSEFFTIDWAGTYRQSTGGYYASDTLILSGGTTGYRTFVGIPIDDIKDKITTSNVPVKVYMHLYNPSYFGVVFLGFHKETSNAAAPPIPPVTTTNLSWTLTAGANKINITNPIITTDTSLNTFDKIVNIGNYLGLIIYGNKDVKYNEAVGKQGIANDMKIEIEGDWDPPEPKVYMQKRETTGFYGLDISSNQNILNPATLFQKSPYYNYFRAYGADHTGSGDIKFVNSTALARQYGVLSGGYFFGTPRKPVGAGTIQSEAREEADLFIAKLQEAYGTGNFGELTPMLDIEEYTDPRTNTAGYPKASGMTATELVQWVLEFRSYFIAQTGRAVGFYSNRYFLTDPTQMAMTTAQLEPLNVMPLWLGEFDRYFPDNINTGPEVIGGWTEYNLWRYEEIGDAANYGMAAGDVFHDYTSDMILITPPPRVLDTTILQTTNTEIVVTFTEPTNDYYTGVDIYLNGTFLESLPIGITSRPITVSTPIGQSLQIQIVSKNIWEDTNKANIVTHVMVDVDSTDPPPIPEEPTYPLNEADVKAMLEFKKGSRQIRFRYNLLDKNEKKIMELPNVLDGEVSMNAFNTIPRTAKFSLREDDTVPINYLSDRIQPFVDLKMPDKWVMDSVGKRVLMKGKWLEFSLGIFILSSPIKKEHGDYIYRDIDAYDTSVILEEDKLQARLRFTQGTLYTDAIVSILLGAGITKYNIVASDKTFRSDVEYDPGIAKSKPIAEFLEAINYRSLYVDEFGYFKSEPYVSPQDQEDDYRYETDEFSVIAVGMEEELDVYSVPNSWVAYYANADSINDEGGAAVTLRSTYVNNNPDSPTSTVSRGRTIVDYRQVDEIADQAALDAYIERIAFQASQIYGKVKFQTAIMPFHSYQNVLYLQNETLGIDGKYSETAWSIKLDAGALMTHEVRKVMQI